MGNLSNSILGNWTRKSYGKRSKVIGSFESELSVAKTRSNFSGMRK
jgi:hypothetical protein